MRKQSTERELTVYITRNAEEFRRVEAELRAQDVRFRVWTTSEYPVLGWTRLDPRLMIRGEERLRTVYHVEVDENYRPNLITANLAIRQATGRLDNAEPVNEII